MRRDAPLALASPLENRKHFKNRVLATSGARIASRGALTSPPAAAASPHSGAQSSPDNDFEDRTDEANSPRSVSCARTQRKMGRHNLLCCARSLADLCTHGSSTATTSPTSPSPRAGSRRWCGRRIERIISRPSSVRLPARRRRRDFCTCEC